MSDTNLNPGGTPLAPVATPPAPPAGHGIAWLPADMNDAEVIGTVQAKQWQGPADVVKGYANLERLLGADRAGRTITIPKDEADADGWKSVWAKLGAPETPEGYELPVPQGQSDVFAKQAAAWFHEAGVPKGQAAKLAGKWNEYVAAQMQAEQQAEQEALAAEHQALAKEWGQGPAAEQQREIARRAAVKLGLDEQAVGALEKTVGFSKVMKAFAKIGELMGEHKAVGLDAGGAFSLTPAAAMARKQQLMADREWGAKAMNPNSREWAELQQLNEIIANSMTQPA